MHELETIATFLNLATQKLFSPPPSGPRGAAHGAGRPKPTAAAAAAKKEGEPFLPLLWWLTETSVTVQIPRPGKQSQETQVLGVGTPPYSSIWIANNDDLDTATQREFLNQIGIKTTSQLVALATGHAHRTLWDPVHDKFDSKSPSEKLISHLTADSKAPLILTTVERTANPTIHLDTHHISSYPSASGLTFVTGQYNGSAGKTHAEQKLLAVLADTLLRRDVPALASPVRIAGIKSPCRTCAAALADARTRLSGIKPAFVLDFATNTSIDEMPHKAGIAADAPPGISLLDGPFYFPEPAAATAAPAAAVPPTTT